MLGVSIPKINLKGPLIRLVHDAYNCSENYGQFYRVIIIDNGSFIRHSLCRIDYTSFNSSHIPEFKKVYLI